MGAVFKLLKEIGRIKKGTSITEPILATAEKKAPT